MTWTQGHRELVLHGRLPLEQGLAFEQAIWEIAKAQRAADKRTASCSAGSSPPPTRSSRSRAAPAVGARAAQRDDGDRAPQRRRAADPRRRRPDQPRDRRTPHLRLAPPHHQAPRPRPRALARRALRVLRPDARAAQTGRHCQYPGCTATRELEAHHIQPHGAAARPCSTTSSCSAPDTTNAPRPPHPDQRQRRKPLSPTPPDDHHRRPATRTPGMIRQGLGLLRLPRTARGGTHGIVATFASGSAECPPITEKVRDTSTPGGSSGMTRLCA